MNRTLSIVLTILAIGPLFSPGGALCRGDERDPVMYRLSFEDFGFLENDYIARSGTKSIEQRGLTLESGRFGKGLKMNLVNDVVTGDPLHNFLLDPVTRVKGYSEMGKNLDNEPFLWGTGRFCPAAGAVAFWIRGPLREGALFTQAAINWGRKEQYLLSVTVDGDGRLGARYRDAGYEWHTISSRSGWNGDGWNHVALNWDRAQGLELFVNGESVASSWGGDAWAEIFMPGLMSFPMPQVVYDEFSVFSRPLSKKEMERLMKDNTPPAADAAPAAPSDDRRERLAKALGLDDAAKLPVVRPMDKGAVFSFREVAPVFMGDGHIPGRFCIDGRYELAWPHPPGAFTLVPGDTDFQAEKLEIEPPRGEPFNYVTIEGNLKGLPAALLDCRKEKDHYTGGTFFPIPQDGRFFFGTTLPRTAHPAFTLPFLKGYGAPEEYTGDVRLAITGETRVHEVGLFDAAEKEAHAVPGEKTYFLSMTPRDIEYRYDVVLRTLHPAGERTVYHGYLTRTDEKGAWVDTGCLRRIHLMTAPSTGDYCAGGILLDLMVKTAGPEDILAVRLRNPGFPSQIWTHAELRLRGFDGGGGRLRLLLEPPPIIFTESDVIWIELMTLRNAAILFGGPDGGRLILKPAPRQASEKAYETKALMPSMAEYTRAPHHLPWIFEKTRPDVMHPYAIGGHFDSLLPAQAVKRVLPHSRLADYYVEFCEPKWKWAYFWEPEKNFPIKSIDIPEGIPRWAYLQHRIQDFRFGTALWLVRNQNPDGQFGGGVKDDVLAFRNKFDIPLDSCEPVRDSYLRVYEAMDDSRMFAGGYCRILPTDTGHVDDIVRYRFYTLLYKPGDPFIYRRAMETAWHWNKPDQTPQNYRDGNSFLYDKNILEWYWGLKKPKADFVTVPPDTLDEKMSRLVSYMDDHLYYRFTEARIHTDRQHIDNEHFVEGMIVGGWGKHLEQEDNSLTVGWSEGGGPDLARWVTSADEGTLVCRMFSFDPLPRKVTGRLFRIGTGENEYEITLSEDREGNPGATISTARTKLRRLDTFTVAVPSKKPVLLTIRRIGPGGPPKNLPDLAVADYDCERAGRTLKVRVSNLGAAKSEQATLRILGAGGGIIGEKKVAPIDAPVDFVEKSVWISFANVPPAGDIHVVIDPENAVEELYEHNNGAVVR